MLDSILSFFRTPQVDPIQSMMGICGKYQLALCFLICLSKFFIAFHQMAILFLAPRVNYTCAGANKTMTCPCDNPKYDKSIFTRTIVMKWDLICERKWLISFTQLIFQLGTLIGSIVFGMASDSKKELSWFYRVEEDTIGWFYRVEEEYHIKYTILSGTLQRFPDQSGKFWLSSALPVFLMSYKKPIGAMPTLDTYISEPLRFRTEAFLDGGLTSYYKRFGRKNPFMLAVVLQVSMAVVAALVPDYRSFTVLRFLVGVSVGGTKVIGLVIILEFVGTEYRDVVSAVYQLPFNIGHMLLPIFAFFFKDCFYFQLGISMPGLILFLYFCLLHESPRWLIVMNETDKAVKVIRRVAQMNGLQTSRIRSIVTAYQATIDKKYLKKGCIIDLFRTPNMRKNIMAMALNWLACNYCFYGVSQYVGQLSGNIFINVLCTAGLTFLGTVFSIPIMRVLGRRTILIIFNFICGGVLLVLAVLPDGYGRVVCACVGVITANVCYVLVYLYCGELFPTVVRNSAVGFSSMSGLVGAMVAPFVINLASVAPWLPPVVLAIVPILAGLGTFLLPETKGRPLLMSIHEGEQFGKKKLGVRAQ